MKTGIITFHNYDNYGAILQSYALQQKLKEHGTDAEIIDYRSAYIGHPFRFVNLKEKGLMNYLYGVIGHICYLPRRRKCRSFRKRMVYGPRTMPDEVSKLNDRYDVFVAGSDQVWDYKLTHFDQNYLLGMAADEKKKFSYAASLGEHLPPEEIRETYTHLLKRFDHILVREQYGAEIIRQMTGEMPVCVCDPTLLLTGREWEQLMAPKPVKGRYILVYQLGVDPSIVKFAQRLAKATGCRIQYVPFPLVGLLKCRCHLTVGPAEWMRLIHDASYVVSDSFHGVIFALLFHRPFYTKVNGHHVNRRVDELMKRIGISGRQMSEVQDDAFDAAMDWDKIDAALADFRASSLRELYTMIDKG